MEIITKEEIKILSEMPEVKHENLQGRGTAKIYYDFLYSLAKKMNPKKIVELGTDRGDGTCRFAHGAPEAKVITIGLPESPEAIKHCEPYPNIDVWFENTWDYDGELQKKVWTAEPEGFIDILLIDTDHSFRKAWTEYNKFGRMVRKGGIILCDDITIDDEMKKFWDKVPEPKVSLPHLHNTGFGVVIKENPINYEGKNEFE